MRALTDTLPILREETTPDAASPAEGFDPGEIARAFRMAKLAEPELMRAIANENMNNGDERPDPVSSQAAALHRTLERFRQRALAAPSQSDATALSNREAGQPFVPPKASEDTPTQPETRSVQPAAGKIPDLTAPTDTESERIDRAVAAALEEARSEAEAAIGAARQEERAIAKAQLEEARAAWVAQEAERFAAAHKAAMAHLSETLQSAIGRALSPVVERKVRQAAVERFAVLLQKHLRDYADPCLVVEGPADLLEALREAMDDPAGITFTPCDTVDLSANIGGTRLSTRLCDWATLIERSEA